MPYPGDSGLSKRVDNYGKLYIVFGLNLSDLLEYNTMNKPRVREPAGMRIPVC